MAPRCLLLPLCCLAGDDRNNLDVVVDEGADPAVDSPSANTCGWEQQHWAAQEDCEPHEGSERHVVVLILSSTRDLLVSLQKGKNGRAARHASSIEMQTRFLELEERRLVYMREGTDGFILAITSVAAERLQSFPRSCRVAD